MHGGRVRRALDADDLDSAWALLEECLTNGFGEKATQPRARITLKEAHPNTTFEGDAVTVELSVCSKRRLGACWASPKGATWWSRSGTR